jgi:predicted dehydrogenase
MEGIRLAAICDSDKQRLADVSRGNPAHAYTDYAEMLRRETLDAMVIAVPARMHVELGLAAIEAGCAVLVEKPLATSLSEARKLAEVAARAGVALMPGHIERFNPALQELACRVQAGEIGRVLQLTARRMGAIRVPPSDVNVVHDSALHDIDAMRLVLGTEVVQVYAQGQAGVLTSAEDGISALMNFEPVQGRAASGSLEVNWFSPRRLRDLAVLGEKGLFVLDYALQTLERHTPPPERAGPVQGWSPSAATPGADIENLYIEPREPLQQELASFLTAVRDGSPMPVTSHDALAALSIADALTESARTGLPVKPELV